MSLLRHHQLLMSSSGSYSGAVIIVQNTTPYVRAFRWSDADGFGSEYPAPPSILGIVYFITFSPERDFVFFAHSSSPGITAFAWDDETGFGTMYQPATALPSGSKTGLSLHPGGGSIAVCHSNSPYVSAYEWDAGSGFGAKYPNPATLPGSSASEVVFHPSGTLIALGLSSSPYQRVYNWDDANGFGSLITPPSPAPSEACPGVAWKPDGTELALGVSSPLSAVLTLRTYAYSAGTFGPGATVMTGNDPGAVNYVRYSPNGRALAAAIGRTAVNCRVISTGGTFDVNPLQGGAWCCAFSPGGKVLAIGGPNTPRAAFYRWDDETGFGAQYALPVTLTGAVRSVAFSGERW